MLPDRAFVYFNLHQHLFSVKDRRTGRVALTTMTVHMAPVVFKVQPGGLARVRRERRKNVHAGLCGPVLSVSDDPVPCPEGWVEITYDPYKFDSFVKRSDLSPVSTAEEALLTGKRVYAKGVK